MIHSRPNHAADQCCGALRDELIGRLPRDAAIFYGPDLAKRSDPEVARLRARGAHFYWVALPVGGVSFWDAHVGIVVDPATLAGTVGIHRSRGSGEAARMFADLAPVFETHQLAHVTAAAADEEQWNGRPLDVSAPRGVKEACQRLVILLEAVRAGGAARKQQSP